ncbi:hypothetical protein BGZ97_008994, partial [Linnemannia gamsii]
MENMKLRNHVLPPDSDQELDTALPLAALDPLFMESYLVDSGTGTDSNSEADETAVVNEDVDMDTDVAISLEQQLERDEGWGDELEPNAEMDPRCFI